MDRPQLESGAAQSGGHGTRRRHPFGMIALVALAVAVGAWFWMAREAPQPQSGIGVSHGVIVVGAGAFIVALIAEWRASGVIGVIEAAFDLIAGLFALLGAIVRGICSAIAEFFGLN